MAIFDGIVDIDIILNFEGLPYLLFAKQEFLKTSKPDKLSNKKRMVKIGSVVEEL